MSHKCKITTEDRYLLNKHKGCVLWFTGLPGAGKSTLAAELEAALYQRQIRSYVLDGDIIRSGLNNDLGFNPEDRRENIRRIGEVAKLFYAAGLFVLSACISPYQEDRRFVRSLFKQGEFIEIYVKCAIDECERRDPKGLYEKARHGIIKNFTGIDAPYEVPRSPELIIETDKQPLHECVGQIMMFLENNGFINK